MRRVWRYFGWVLKADFARGKICVKFVKIGVAKGANNGYKKRCPEFSPDIAAARRCRVVGIRVAQSW